MRIIWTIPKSWLSKIFRPYLSTIFICNCVLHFHKYCTFVDAQLYHLIQFSPISASTRIFYARTFTPRSGQLEAALRLKPAAGPPLSVEKIMMELLSILRSSSAATTSPIHWSSFDNIPVWNRTRNISEFSCYNYLL